MTCHSLGVRFTMRRSRCALTGTLALPLFLAPALASADVQPFPTHIITSDDDGFFGPDQGFANGASAVFAIDLDSDGDTDVLSAARTNDQIAWYENIGGAPPTYVPHVITTNANFALSVFAIDVNGDGRIDVLSASRNDDTIAWYENNGGSPPTFTERLITTTADGANWVIAADLDGDSDIDVVSSSEFDDAIRWYENSGGLLPTFTTHVITQDPDGPGGGAQGFADSPQSVFAIDLDGDSDIDILSASSDNDRIAWYENNGAPSPSFTPRVISDTADVAWSVVAADIDGDSLIDVVSGSSRDDKVAWYRNLGGVPATFSAPNVITIHPDGVVPASNGVSSVVAIDVDADGDVDVAAISGQNDRLRWFESDGAATPMFTEHLVTDQADGGEVIYAEDVDDDGDIDFLSASIRIDEIAWYGVTGPPVVNLNTLAEFNAISDAIAAANSGHTLQIIGEVIPLEPHIDFLGKALTLQSNGAFEQPEGGIYDFADGAMIEAAPTRGIQAAGVYDIPVGAAVDVVAENFIQRATSIVTLGDASKLVADAASSLKLGGRVDLGDNAMLLTPARLTLGGVPPTYSLRLASSDMDGGQSSVAADLDGDGDLDIVTASYDDDSVAWLDNDGQAPPSFTYRLISNTVNGANDVATVDLDGDGDLDVVAAARIGDEVVWFENLGGSPPSFMALTAASGLNDPTSIAVRDLNDDEAPDIVVAANASNSVFWLENNGANPPMFTQRTITTSADGARNVTTADVNGDGFFDVISASRDDNTIAWHQSNGANPPMFTPHVVDATLLGAGDVAAHDIDGDGDVDLAASGFNADLIAIDEIVWYENLGGGSPAFVRHVLNDNVASGVSVTIRDIDRDGDQDILSAGFIDRELRLFENDGDTPPVFTERMIAVGVVQVRDITTGDLDGDADIDVIATSQFAGRVEWFEAAGSGQARSALTLGAGARVLSGDEYRQTQLTRLTTTGAAPFAPSAMVFSGEATLGGEYRFLLDAPMPPQLGDRFDVINASAIEGQFRISFFPGLPDPLAFVLRIVEASEGPASGETVTVQVEELLAGLQFENPTDTNVQQGVPTDAVAGFFNGDGALDLAVTIPDALGGNGSVVVLLGDPMAPGAFLSGAQIPVGVNPSSIDAGFLDADGILDLAVTNAGDDTVTILFGAGDGTFTSAGDFATGPDPSAVAIALIDANALGDVLVTNANNGGGGGSLTVIFDAGLGPFADSFLLNTPVGSGPSTVCPADVDMDRQADAVVANSASGDISVVRYLGNRVFAAQAVFEAGNGPTSLAIADLDGDGLPDLIIANLFNTLQPDGSLNGEVSILINESSPGNVQFAPAIQIPVGLNPQSVKSVDWDADGDPDIAVIAGDPPVIKIIRNDTLPGGASGVVLAEAMNVSSSVVPAVLESGDVDADGDEDLITVGAMASSFAVTEGAAPIGGVGFHPAVVGVLGDLNGDGIVNGADLATLLANWGLGGAADLSGDGIVNGADLATLLANWTS